MSLMYFWDLKGNGVKKQVTKCIWSSTESTRLLMTPIWRLRQQQRSPVRPTGPQISSMGLRKEKVKSMETASRSRDDETGEASNAAVVVFGFGHWTRRAADQRSGRLGSLGGIQAAC